MSWPITCNFDELMLSFSKLSIPPSRHLPNALYPSMRAEPWLCYSSCHRRSFNSSSTGDGGRASSIKRSLSNNPFHILGIPKNSSVQTAQKAFIKLALQHHPDTSDAAVSEHTDFIRIRQAFERIRDGHKNSNRTRNNNKGDSINDIDRTTWTEEDFLDWFYEQTGFRVSPSQRRELIQLHRSRVPGGQYNGSMWELARRLTQEQDAFLLKQQQQQQEQGGTCSSSSFSTSSSNASHDRKQQANDSATTTMRRRRRR